MSLEKTISDAVEARAARIVETLTDLIAFESVSRPDPAPAGPGEAPAQEYLKRRIEALGFEAELWEPDPAPLLEKYRGRPGAIEGRRFERRPNLGGRLKGSWACCRFVACVADGGADDDREAAGHRLRILVASNAERGTTRRRPSFRESSQE